VLHTFLKEDGDDMQQQPPDQPYTTPPGQNPMGDPNMGQPPMRETPPSQPGMQPESVQGTTPPAEWHHAHTETEAIRDAGLQPGSHQYITLADMVGRAIVDLGTGTQFGIVADTVLSRDYHTIEAFTTHSQVLQGSDAFPANNTMVGADAVTLPRGAMQGFDETRLRGLPFASALLEMHLMTDSGQTVGTLKEIRFDPRNNAVLGYEVESSTGGFFKRLSRQRSFLPVDAIENYGNDVLLVSEANANQYLGG
jgi:uncharacterized protein YrrD